LGTLLLTKCLKIARGFRGLPRRENADYAMTVKVTQKFLMQSTAYTPHLKICRKLTGRARKRLFFTGF